MKQTNFLTNKDITSWGVMKTIGAVFSSLIVTVLMVIITYTVSVKVFSATPILTYYTILSDSMTPTASRGDMVFVVTADFDALKEGDIITFYADVNLDGKKEVVTHYFAGYSEDGGATYIRTHSEDANALDSWRISPSELLGKSVFIIPKIGRYAEFFRSPLGLATLFLDILFIIVAVFLIESLDKETASAMLKTPLTQKD